jgi:hypothetical protein
MFQLQVRMSPSGDDFMTMWGKSIGAMYDEGKEACIHCKAIWYSIHYKDGVCHSCQQLKKPGRSVLAACEWRKECLIRIGFTAFLLLLAWLLLG